MAMSMMKVGNMRVRVVEVFVPVRVRVGLRALVAAVFMPVVLVVNVPVFVLRRLVHVSVGVLRSDEEPGARNHDERSHRDPQARDFPKQEPG